jgi:membrane protease YdiL (CAAX protease family)
MFRALFEWSVTAAGLASALQSWALQFCVVLTAGILFAILGRWTSYEKRGVIPPWRGYLRSACIAYAATGILIIVFVLIRMRAGSQEVAAGDLLRFLMDRNNFVFIAVLDDCALLLLVVLEMRRPEVAVFLRKAALPAVSAGRVIVLVCAAVIILSVAQWAFSYLSGLRNSPSLVRQVARAVPHSLGFICWMMWLVLVVPISEELYFRKLLYSTYKALTGRATGQGLQALFFVAMHVQSGQLASIAVAAIVFGLGYEVSGSILVPIVAHGLVNLLAVLRAA